MVVLIGSSGKTIVDVILDVAVESLVLTIFNFEICKVAAAMLSGQRAFFQVDIGILLLFLRVYVVGRGVHFIAILVIKGSIGSVIRNFAHTFRINRHRLMSSLSHSEYLAHLRWGRCSAIDASCHVSFVLQSVLFS